MATATIRILVIMEDLRRDWDLLDRLVHSSGTVSIHWTTTHAADSSISLALVGIEGVVIIASPQTANRLAQQIYNLLPLMPIFAVAKSPAGWEDVVGEFAFVFVEEDDSNDFPSLAVAGLIATRVISRREAKTTTTPRKGRGSKRIDLMIRVMRIPASHDLMLMQVEGVESCLHLEVPGAITDEVIGQNLFGRIVLLDGKPLTVIADQEIDLGGGHTLRILVGC